MKHRDQLLVLAVLGLAASAGLLGPRSSGPGLVAALSLAALAATALAWARWLVLGGPSLRARSLLLSGAVNLVAVTLWSQYVFAELFGIRAPLRWALALALAWMSAPFLALAMIRLARRMDS